VKKKTPMLTFK